MVSSAEPKMTSSFYEDDHYQFEGIEMARVGPSELAYDQNPSRGSGYNLN
jgi:hypothetical protein